MSRSTRDLSTPRAQFDDICRPTNCPKCSSPVFFIRHNGGSIWVDSLGWPWPKHSCFDDGAVPSWFSYFKKQSFSVSAENVILFGLVIKAEWLREDHRGPTRIVLAVDGGTNGRACLATTGTNTADYLLGRIVIVDVKNKRLVTSNHEVRSILRVYVSADELGLPADWVTVKMADASDEP